MIVMTIAYLHNAPYRKPRYGDGATSAMDKIVIGNGRGLTLRASNQNTKAMVNSNPNRTVTGVFITRLDPRTSPHKIELHIRHETGLNVRAEKLDTKWDSYSSFYIGGDRYIRDTIMYPGLWPAGVLVKHYHS